jgi:excisionase family DNA binding protein
MREIEVSADLSPSQAAQQTGLSRTLIYREIARGHLPAYKVGRRLRITPQALAEWKRQHTVVPRSASEPARRSPSWPRSSATRPRCTYTHVIRELQGQPVVSAEEQIELARSNAPRARQASRA